MNERSRVVAVAESLAEAVSRRDAVGVSKHLTTGFVLRVPGKPAVGRAEFLEGIRQLPDGIEFVRLRDLEVDVEGTQAVVTGVQHARVRMGGQTIDEHKPFVDWFVRDEGGEWRVRVALDLPALSD